MRINRIIYLACLAATPLFFTSCDSDDGGGEVAPATEEGSKEKLREDGIAMVESMERLRDTEALMALETFVTLFEGEDDDDVVFVSSARLGKLVAASVIASVDEDVVPGEFLIEEDDDEAENLEELWLEFKGTHTYNFQTDEFDFQEGGDVVTINFPSDEDGTVNNTVLTISDFGSTPAKTDVLESDLEYSGDLPTSLKANLAIASIEVMTFSFSASYDSQDDPMSVNTTVALVPFSVSIGFSNNGSTASYNTSFKENDNVILASSMSVSGDVGYDDLEELFNDEDEDDDIDEDLDITLPNLKSFVATNQIQNTKLVLSIADINKLVDEIEALDKDLSDEIITDAAFNTAVENILNAQVKVDATFADTNQKIADASIDLYEPENDEDSGLDIILTYADGTKVAIDEFIDSSFDGIEQDLEDLLESLEDEEDDIF